ncbi:hypothetical protein IBTHAUMO2_780009 [Nitrosopumilaceae archaeon]|nr:hypothetical protein IBTHAUMO2_780009 [Nitrosopumilaceae archaeon]
MDSRIKRPEEADARQQETVNGLPGMISRQAAAGQQVPAGG